MYCVLRDINQRGLRFLSETELLKVHEFLTKNQFNIFCKSSINK